MKFGLRENRPYLQNKQSRRILSAAKGVFVAAGAAGFSARRVAKQAKLSLGSVQHVFPTTDALVAAMLEHVNDGYEVAYREMAARLPFNAEERLIAALDYHLEDICVAEQRSFWFGFWALSCHNKNAASLLRQAYRHHTGNVAAFIGAARPSLSEERCLAAATQVVALIEGTMIFTAIAERKVSFKSPLIQNVRRTILEIISVGSSDGGDSAQPALSTAHESASS